MVADRTRRPIWSVLVWVSYKGLRNKTHHPTITAPAAIHQPASDLPRSLDDQQATETLRELENGCRPSQKDLPVSQSDSLHQTIATKDPFMDGGILRPLPIKSALDPGAVIVQVGEAVQGPDEED